MHPIIRNVLALVAGIVVGSIVNMAYAAFLLSRQGLLARKVVR